MNELIHGTILPETREQLLNIVDRMKDKGAELSDEDASALTEYLAKTYGPKQ